jgi:TM2 domain-containing membrane protein YozV
LYLCFFWTFIPAILAVFDIIVALTKTPDGNGRIVV